MSGAARRSVLVAALALAVVPPATTFSPDSAQARRVATGAYIPGADLNPGEIGRYARKIGRRPLIVHIYKDWGNPVFQQPQLRSIWRRGAVPMISWEPNVPLGRIAGGGYDRYVRAAARAAALWGKPVFLRFGWEMNGNWFSWTGTRPATYKAAWRHLVRIFRRHGAGKVRWVWTPYVNNRNRLPFRRFYPGDKWVDWAGVDGFNWGGPVPWQSFRDVFASSYQQLVRLTSRPLMLAEFGSGESGGSKARWVTRAMTRQVPRMDHIRALVWFSRDVSDPPGADFRVDSSRSALRALRRATDKRLYAASRRQLLRTPRHLRRFPSPTQSGRWAWTAW